MSPLSLQLPGRRSNVIADEGYTHGPIRWSRTRSYNQQARLSWIVNKRIENNMMFVANADEGLL